MEKKGLGKGLEALIPILEEKENNLSKINTEDIIQKIDISKIKANKYQPRHEFNNEKLKELAESIKQKGIIQPLIITESVVPGEYELIAGERRLRAANLAGLKQVPAIIKKSNEQEKFLFSLIENLQRENLNPIEEANAYKKLTTDFNLTQEQIANIVGKDRTVITNVLRLLNLPDEIQDLISKGLITTGHARTLAGLTDKQQQKQLADKILNEKLTVREIEKLVADWKKETSKIKRRKRSPEVVSLENDLQKILGTKVELKTHGKKGKLIIYFYSLNELDNILKFFKKTKIK